MKKSKTVICGSFMADITGFAQNFPLNGQTVTGDELKIGPGGKSSNSATAAKRAGGDVSLIVKVGNDVFADIARNHYKAEQIRDEFIFVSEKSATGVAIIEVSKATGENRIIVISGANLDMTPAEVKRAEEKIMECDCVLIQLEAGIDAVREAITLGHKYGKTVIVNPAPAVKVSREFFEYATFFTPNETEAEFYTGIRVDSYEKAFEAGRSLLQMGVKNALITLGSRGSALVTEKTEMIIPAYNVRVVDTTGAGDAFNGALAVALGEGNDTVGAIRFASAVAALSVTKAGSSVSMPRREAIDEFIRSHGIN